MLILLACLIPVDVGVRRVQLDWSVIRGWFTRSQKTESTETLGALLRRKGEVRETTGTVRTTIAVSRPPARPAPSSETVRPAKPAAPKTAPEPETPSSTTERLLAMKRKRQQQDDNNDTKQ
jgi:hypothetical protein